VSEDEAKLLRREGHRPGDPAWEALGIFTHVTVPRITAAVTGRTPDGDAVDGAYKFTDEFPMAEGFEENVAFFDLNYLDPEWPGKAAVLRSQPEAKSLMLYEKSGARGIRTLDTA
jgi:adenine-specific DNA-methyltransferase